MYDVNILFVSICQAGNDMKSYQLLCHVDNIITKVVNTVYLFNRLFV
jgi:hypothetical protein